MSANLRIYPNPFVESVNFRFTEGGDYTINIVNTNGAVIQSNAFKAGAGDTVNVAVTGSKGVYIIQVLKSGKLYKAVKVIKQ